MSWVGAIEFGLIWLLVPGAVWAIYFAVMIIARHISHEFSRTGSWPV